MCDYRVLFHDDSKGYIIQCRQCERWQIGFGNMLVTLLHEEFPRFCNYVWRIKAELDPSEMKSQARCITILTPAEGIYFLLSASELCELCQMLDQADNEKKAKELLELFRS